MRILDGIATLAEQYEGFILDLWGVVHDGQKPYPGVADALARLQAAGKRVAYLSNAPRRAWVVDRMLAGMGLERRLWNITMTSGELAWRHLTRRDHPFFARLGRHAFHIGLEHDQTVLEETGVELVHSPSEADWVLNSGPDMRRGRDGLEPYEETLAACAGLDLPMLCVNPDRFVMVGERRVLCAGALADRYRDLGGSEVLEIGKPDPAAYPPVLEALGLRRDARVLAIGDSPHTDLAGAQAAGLDALWALTGLAAHAHGGDPSPEQLDAAAAAEDVAPVAALRELRW
jgi:HAD superfamily hydrolase (TIGR01459 family)